MSITVHGLEAKSKGFFIEYLHRLTTEKIREKVNVRRRLGTIITSPHPGPSPTPEDSVSKSGELISKSWFNLLRKPPGNWIVRFI